MGCGDETLYVYVNYGTHYYIANMDDKKDWDIGIEPSKHKTSNQLFVYIFEFNHT